MIEIINRRKEKNLPIIYVDILLFMGEKSNFKWGNPTNMTSAQLPRQHQQHKVTWTVGTPDTWDENDTSPLCFLFPKPITPG